MAEGRELDVYFAGYLDGEGCFRWQSGPVVEVTTADRRMAAALQDYFGGMYSPKRASPKRTKPLWRWRARGPEAVNVIKRVRPHAIEKGSQCAVLLEMDETGPEERKVLDRALRALKKVRYPHAA